MEPITWLKPKNDFIFKLIFGSDRKKSKALLLSLLNDFLQVPDGKSFGAVEIVNPFTDKQNVNDKLSVFDIKAKISGYGYANVEIQLTNQKNIHKRSLYYGAKLYEEQLGKGDDYYQLTKVTTINLLDFEFFTSDAYYNCYRLMEEKTGEPFPDLMQLHFIEMPKFVRQQQERSIPKNDRMAKWLHFLTNEDDMRWAKMAKQDPMLEMAVDILKQASLDPETRMQYEAREKALKDIASIRGDSKREGKYEGKLEIAKKMIKKGMALELIAEMTELPLEEVETLKNKLT
ncbi:Rpn family recombination-promoting nuclease/putative transposase [Alkalihalobacillus oceani]|uniref:Rpn family recombination-promoting nuclease/putative transposase n=1 Tax=Halalkalibacter oceani TaxID=1653776 RepID=A0A9X2IPU2_9BACI|nr:Rpn family recombination-promoting nuclease/putative transposase [Halalkalibacter oceani]MCM3715610.1 Rpn family recombination-promoting nuclease/putative transposase [Halalkalibacter oceani]